ncbi:MAG TPA: mammalian cell entry protein [Mycobacterium sp.]|nr:mammalian cell entry protein [Mycobacterium sp.]
MADDADSADSSVTVQPEAVSSTSGIRLAAWFGVLAVMTIGALATWLGMQALRTDDHAQREALLLNTARQSALDLTTIDAGGIDGSVQRILDSSTGVFHDDFQKRAASFAEFVKQSQASSEGTVTEAGIESSTDTGVQVLVAVAVQTTTEGVTDQQPRLWRMRLTFEQLDATPKLSDVVFVP